jgi:hypothetical protein
LCGVGGRLEQAGIAWIRASLTLKLREKLALLGERYKGFAKIAEC